MKEIDISFFLLTFNANAGGDGELALNNNVEICWLFYKSKSQFRFRGKLRIDLSNENLRHWDQLSDKSKAMWNWPCPGEQFVLDQINDKSINAKQGISDNFAVLKIEIITD